MSTLTLELPTPLTIKIAELKIPTEQVHSFVMPKLETWVDRKAKGVFQEEKKASLSSEAQPTSEAHAPFSESAVPFIEQLISENQTLFEALAKL